MCYKLDPVNWWILNIPDPFRQATELQPLKITHRNKELACLLLLQFQNGDWRGLAGDGQPHQLLLAYELGNPLATWTQTQPILPIFRTLPTFNKIRVHGGEQHEHYLVISLHVLSKWRAVVSKPTCGAWMAFSKLQWDKTPESSIRETYWHILQNRRFFFPWPSRLKGSLKKCLTSAVGSGFFFSTSPICCGNQPLIGLSCWGMVGGW